MKIETLDLNTLYEQEYDKGMPKEFNNNFDVKVLIDTREQMPLNFKKSSIRPIRL